MTVVSKAVPPDSSNITLSQSSHFATLVDEDESSYTIEVSFKLLQSEIHNIPLQKAIVSIFYSGNSSDTGSATANLTESEKILNDYNIKLKNLMSKQGLLLSKKEIDLQSYVKATTKPFFDLKTPLENIPTIYEEVDSLEIDTSDFEYNFSGGDSKIARNLSMRLLSEFSVDPTAISSQIYTGKEYSAPQRLLQRLKSFYLNDAIASCTKESTYYKATKLRKFKDEVTVKSNVKIQKFFNKNRVESVDVLLQICGKNNRLIKTTDKKPLSLSLLSSYSNVSTKKPSLSYSFPNRALTVSQNSNIDSFSISKKEISNSGDAGRYSTFSQVRFPKLKFKVKDTDSIIYNESKIQVDRAMPNKIVIYRCSADSKTNFINYFFSNVVVGDSVKIDTTSLVIGPDQRSSGVRILVKNIPYYASQIEIQKGFWTGSTIDRFVTIKSFSNFESYSFSFVDSFVNKESTYEYKIRYKTTTGTVIDSKTMLYTHIPSADSTGVFGKLNLVTNSTSDGKRSISFNAKLSVNLDEEQKIERLLSEAGVNFAEKFGGEVKRDLEKINKLLHPVLFRVNLKTGDRQKYEPSLSDNFGGGEFTFIDDNDSQRKFGNDAIDPTTNYRYELVAYLKPPTTMLKSYVRENTIELSRGKTKTYYYKPYKSSRSSVLSSGTIFAQDLTGKTISNSVLDDGLVGVVDTFTINSSAAIPEVKEVIAEKVDKNKIKLTWKTNVDVNEYDHFVIVKEVSKKREILGCVLSTSLDLIDVLGDKDRGTVIYYVIPVLKDYSTGSAQRSVALILDPEDFA